MEDTFNNRVAEPYVHSCANILTEVNKEFLDFTGFTINELLGKSLIEIGDMIKINSQILLDNITFKYSGYIFTKSLSSREVNISLSYDKETNEKVYTFIEKPNSRLDDKLIFEEQAFIDDISGVAVYSAPDFILLKANQKYFDLIDSTINEGINIIGKPIREIVKEFEGSQVEVTWNSILETNKTSYIKDFKIDKTSIYSTYWSFAQTTIFEKGKAKYIFETASEVTKRVFKNQCVEMQNKIIEQQKKQLEELEAIIENISSGISIFDNKGQYISLNKSEREMCFPHYECIDKANDRYKLSDLYDISGEKILPENTPSRRVMRGEKFKNMRMLVKFPDKMLQIDISGTPIYDSEGNFILGVLCSREMTDYIKQEETIKSRYEFLNRMIDTFDLPVIRLSCPDLKITDINKKAFGTIKLLRANIESIAQVKDIKIEDLFENFKTSEYYQCISEVLSEKKPKYLNKINHRLINGNEIYWNVIFEPMIEVNGEIEEILILIIDVTAEIKSNIDMEKALQLQGEFLVNVSHELKTPLNVIFATAQLFNVYCDSGSLDDKKSLIIKYIESIKQNSYRLSKIINNIVDLSKIEAGFYKLNLSNNNIIEVVEEIVMSVTTFTDSKGINIIFDTDVEDKIIACDPDKIERIVLNLISNAIKFTDEGDEILVAVKDKNEFVEISVKDNGIGIEAEYLDMIFDRFKQVDKSLSRNSEGTGVGLSLVKSIVELHGGSMYVESEFGKGSKFTVMLPSRKVLHENIFYNNEVKSGNQNIRVELSDVCS